MRTAKVATGLETGASATLAAYPSSSAGRPESDPRSSKAMS